MRGNLPSRGHQGNNGQSLQIIYNLNILSQKGKRGYDVLSRSRNIKYGTIDIYNVDFVFMVVLQKAPDIEGLSTHYFHLTDYDF